jgi:hypothetical protein
MAAACAGAGIPGSPEARTARPVTEVAQELTINAAMTNAAVGRA